MSPLTLPTARPLPGPVRCVPFQARFRAELLRLFAGMATLR